MKTLITGAFVYGAGNADIGIENDFISFIGVKPDTFTPDFCVDAKRCVVLPGLVNAHTHSAMTLLRNLADDLAFSDWLFGKVIPFENTLTGDDIYWGAMLAAAEMIRSGVTAFADMYIHTGRLAEAIAETGMKASISYGPITSAARGGGQIVDEKSCADFIKKWDGAQNGRIKTCVEIHSVFLYDLNAITAAAALAKSLGVSVHTHISESLAEQATVMEKYGKTPAQVCLETGMFDTPAIAAHCVHVNENDISILAANGVTAVHCPASNLKLGNGAAPAEKMRKAGVTLSLGTDGCCSNNNLNMFEEMHIAAILHKGAGADAQVFPADEIIKMATLNGAQALGFTDTGVLKHGYKADLIIVDADKPHLCPLGHVPAAIVYAAQAADVRDVMADGVFLMKNRELTTVDEEKAKFYAKKLRGEA